LRLILRSMKNILFLVLSFVFLSDFSAQSVGTMISSGIDNSEYAAISPENRYVAKLSNARATVWDFRTGRLIREVKLEGNSFTGKNSPDSLSFSSDEKKLFIGYCALKKIMEVNIENGLVETREISSVSPLPSLQSQNVQKMIKSTELFSFPSPDGKSEVVYQNIMEDGKRVFLNVFIKKDGVLSPKLCNSVSINFKYSGDSRYLFANEFVYDLLLNQRVCDLKSVPFTSLSCAFLPNTNTAITAGVNEIIIWDFPRIRQIKADSLFCFITSEGGEYLAYETNDIKFPEARCILVRVSDGKRTGFPLVINPKETEALSGLSRDGKYLITSSSTGIRLYNFMTGALVHHFKDLGFIDKCFFTGNNEILVFKNQENSFLKYDIEMNKLSEFPLAKEFSLGKEKFFEAFYDKGCLLLSAMNTNYLLNLTTKEVLATPGTNIFAIGKFAVEISDDKKLLAVAGLDRIITVYDVSNNKILYRLKGHNFHVFQLAFSADNKFLLSASLDGSVKYWNTDTGNELATIFSTGYKEFVITTPEQYYYSTKRAAEYLHFVKGENLYAFEQFDFKYNRPDLVLEKLGCKDKKAIEAYRKAYLKRLKKMKFTEEMLKDDFHLPEAKIKNTAKIATETDKSELQLDIELTDTKYQLDRINVWINDVAVYGTAGISLRDKSVLQYKTVLNLQLKKGMNKVQLSVLNVAGAESYKETISVKCSQGKEKPDLYVIGIGVSEYAQTQYNLKYAAKDAADLAKTFSAGKNYGLVHSKILANKDATLANLLQLKEFLKTADRNDEVILFYAGHGVLDKNLDYYLASGDMDFTNPSAKGISYEVLESVLDGIAPLKKLLLMDACHSGEIDKEEVQLTVSEAASGNIKFRNVGNTVAQKESFLGLQNTSELSKSLFSDLRKGTGATVISSAGGAEYAMESDQWKNGLFTYCLLHGLKDLAADINKDGQIMLTELQQYLQAEVTKLSNGAQQPTSRIENISMDFKIW
jgi:WD40 repeat protein